MNCPITPILYRVKPRPGQSFYSLACLFLIGVILATNGDAQGASPSTIKVSDSVVAVGVQTNFDHRYRRFARLLRASILNGRPTPESIVRTSVLRDSIRTEFLRVTAEKLGQWDINQQTAYFINVRNLLLLSRVGLDLDDSTSLVLASRTVSLQSLNDDLAAMIVRDPRLAITLFSSIPYGPGWSSEPVRYEQLDSALTECWRDYLNRPEVMTINSNQRRISVNTWLGTFAENLAADWAESSRFVNADAEIAPLLAFLWSIADEAMKTRLETTDRWTLVRPPRAPAVLTAPAPSVFGEEPLLTSPGQ